ncbi:MAG: protein kinase [Victivallales bacterium]|nr:protein kinase [Victivallales bacterium]
MREGDTFAGCRIICVCGTGAYGTVYLAKDALGRKVALKVFHAVSPDDKVLDALRRYAELPECGNILVKILHFGVEDGHLFYLMEAADNASEVDGQYQADTLALRLQRNGRLRLDEALAIYRQLLNGMAVLHNLGLVHRDIKPANIFYVNGKVKLGDPDLLNDYSRTMSVAGSLGFIPPEFLTAKQPKTPVGDIYALGKTFYCAVTGEEPDAYPHYPTDLPADTLYSIVLPLSRICNRNPDMRANSCGECLELMSNKRNADTSRWRQVLTKMALSSRYRNTVLALALALLVCVGFIGYGASFAVARMRRVRAEAKAECEARSKEMTALLPRLALQLDKEQMGDLEGRLYQANKALQKGKFKAFNHQVDEIEAQLRQLAADAVPQEGKDFNSVANMLGFLSSPLGSKCLDKNVRDRLMNSANGSAEKLTVTHSPCLGMDFRNPAHRTNIQFRMAFMPPGRYMQPVTPLYSLNENKMKVIEYPYWIFDREVSNELCNQVLGVDYVSGEGQSMPCTQLNWYEIIRFCQTLTSHWSSAYVLPKGYAVRPPTEAEWEYAAVGGWAGVVPEVRSVPKAIHTVYEGNANELGIYDMDGNCAELTIAGALPDSSEVVLRGRNVVFFGKTGVGSRSIVARDVLRIPGAGFRVVLAPTPDDFFQRQYAMPPVELRTAQVNGRHFAAISTYYAVVKHDMARELAASLKAQLYESRSLEEIAQVYKALQLPRWPAFLGARYENGAWLRFSDKQPLALPNLPKPKGEAFTSLCSTENSVICNLPDDALPNLILEWTSEEAWQGRADLWKSGNGPCIVGKISVQGREFILVRGTMAGYSAAAFCGIAGARPAVLNDEALRKAVIERLKDLDCPVTIGANLRGQKWQWLDNSPVFPVEKDPLLEPVTGRFSMTYKHVIPVLVIFGGKLMSTRETEMMLVEFP